MNNHCIKITIMKNHYDVIYNQLVMFSCRFFFPATQLYFLQHKQGPLQDTTLSAEKGLYIWRLFLQNAKRFRIFFLTKALYMM